MNRQLLMMLAVCGFAVLTFVPSVQAGDLSVDEIVEKALRSSYYKGSDGRAQIAMKIVDSQGRERNRGLVILRKDAVDGDDPDDLFIGDQKYYAYFRLPADVRKTVFLVWKHADLSQDDDRWLYLPDLDLVKRIASSEERTSFVGSHFFYEDVSGRTMEEDDHEMVETTDNFYVLKHTPKNPGDVEFTYYKTWIHKETFLVTQTEYVDAKDKVYRTYQALGVETVQGYPTVTKAKITDDHIGGYTELSYSGVRYNQGLPDDIFTERYLRKAPIEFLK